LSRRGEFLFFASPKKRNQKKGDPAACVPLGFAVQNPKGNLRCSPAGDAAELTARLCHCVQTTAASQITLPRRLCASAQGEGIMSLIFDEKNQIEILSRTDVLIFY